MSVLKLKKLFAQIDKVEKIDDEHFMIELYKYSKMDEILKRLKDQFLGKNVVIYIYELKTPCKREQYDSTNMVKEGTNKVKQSKLYDNPFWDIPEMMEE